MKHMAFQICMATLVGAVTFMGEPSVMGFVGFGFVLGIVFATATEEIIRRVRA